MAKTKIAHIITQLELGGAQENTLYTVTHLEPELYDAFLITGPGGVLDKEAVASLDNKILFVPTMVREVRPWRDLLSLINIYRLCRQYDFAIVHTHSSKAGILGRWAAKLAGVKTIIHTFHGFGFNDFQKSWTRWFFIWIERLTARISDKLIVVSTENTKKALGLKIGWAEQYQVIHSGIKTADYRIRVDTAAEKRKLNIPVEAPVVGMIACFKPQKAPLDFIRIAAAVRAQRPEVRFLLVGDGELRAEIEKLIKELDLSQTVIMAGWRRDINIVMQLVDVVVLTSLWEGLPRVILEAFVSGKPVVATPADGTKEVISDGVTGYLAGYHQVQLFGEKIIYLLKNPAVVRQLSDAAAKLIRGSYDIDIMVQELSKLYQSVKESAFVG